ncbi:hypothetical protein [Protaetiibacter larvae]|uniref:Nuclear transport factor 2 family protein n=1 Tax=Protaetiibacter larvae TaxID=2592654 RepID=A0A5C1Y8Q6_9MICO|nr:hypothetical protein [Protaetiibacter larvae]QEO10473.1 hypothetical protein FLP23_10935 [Protaetiibacter larvae]
MSRRILRAVPVVLIATLTLTGCLPGDPPVTPPATPSAEPVFASDEEALAAAEEAYGKYLAVVDAVFADGGANPERLLEVASESVYEIDRLGFEEMAQQHLRGTGAATFVLKLQSFESVDGEVVAYSCDDISATDILDADGRSIVAGSRPTRIPYEVRFDGDPLTVVERTLWQGQGVCD